MRQKKIQKIVILFIFSAVHNIQIGSIVKYNRKILYKKVYNYITIKVYYYYDTDL